MGGIRIQLNGEDERVVAYASKILNKAQQKYFTTELELYAIIFAVDIIQFYLSSDTVFKIVTDQFTTKNLLKTKSPTGRPARWIL